MKKLPVVASVLCIPALLSHFASAGTEFLYIGSPGNLGDTRVMSDGTTGYGAVEYDYYIMRHAVSNADWDFFVQHAGAPTGADRGYSVDSTFLGDNKPVHNVSWYEAAQYCNWLTSGDKYLGVYLFSPDDGSFLGIDREAAVLEYQTAYAIPNEDEWHKSAYYNAETDTYWLYANGTDTPPEAQTEAMYAQSQPYHGPWNVNHGTQEQNGTYNMMGNAWEWVETAVGPYRVLRGGAYDTREAFVLSSTYRHYIAVPHMESGNVGFRVVQLVIPEPTSVALLALGGLAVLRKKRSAARS